MLKNKIIYLLLLYFVLSYSVIYHNYDGFLLEVIVIALPLVAIIIMFIHKSKIRVHLKNKVMTVRRDDDYMAVAVIDNPTPFPVLLGTLVITEDGRKQKEDISVKGFSQHVIQISGNEEHCGIHDICIDKLYVYDYFKLCRINAAKKSVAEVTILPRLFGIEGSYIKSFSGNSDDADTSSDKKGDDVSEIVEIREYRDGDNIRRIHQKLSVRMNKLMVKEFGSEQEAMVEFRILLCTGNSEEEKQTNDLMLDSMYSVMATYIKNNIKILGVKPQTDRFYHETVFVNEMYILDRYMEDILRITQNKEALLSYQRNDSDTAGRSCLYFAADIQEDILLGYDEQKDLRTCIFVPESYRDKMEAYRNIGYEIEYVRTKGGEEL